MSLSPARSAAFWGMPVAVGPGSVLRSGGTATRAQTADTAFAPAPASEAAAEGDFVEPAAWLDDNDDDTVIAAADGGAGLAGDVGGDSVDGVGDLLELERSRRQGPTRMPTPYVTLAPAGAPTDYDPFENDANDDYYGQTGGGGGGGMSTTFRTLNLRLSNFDIIVLGPFWLV